MNNQILNERFTMELPNPISPRVQQPIISWEEQLHDHNQKIEEYLQNRVFRGCTYESTVKSARTVLKRLFDLVPIPDPNHRMDIATYSCGSSWIRCADRRGSVY